MLNGCTESDTPAHTISTQNLILSAIMFRLETIILNGSEWMKQECNLIPVGPVSANGMFLSQQRHSFDHISIMQIMHNSEQVSE